MSSEDRESCQFSLNPPVVVSSVDRWYSLPLLGHCFSGLCRHAGQGSPNLKVSVKPMNILFLLEEFLSK